MKQSQHSAAITPIEHLRRELVSLVESELTPVALRYGFSSAPLEDKIKWRPIVLLLGNYSSGKSTLINELLGVRVQETGQAPTDDSFTVISSQDEGDPWEERDGMVLLNDPRYPFSHLKKQGQSFAAHFRLKQLKSPLLENLALIDTPGMLDSVTEKDRGYNYQEVIAELASIADLILVLFDPHKAGTIRETYQSLRQTLPRVTFEDRVLFVLNRIDECAHLPDLLRVYGTLCWNLSQMTGRKDIPPIYLTHSTEVRSEAWPEPDFLKLLPNQRPQLKATILRAPKYRLDHLATYIETQGEQLAHFLEALRAYALRRRWVLLRSISYGLILAITLAGAGAAGWYYGGSTIPAADTLLGAFALASALIFVLWLLFVSPWFLQRFHRQSLSQAANLTKIDRQNRRESWEQVEARVGAYLREKGGRVSLINVSRDLKRVTRVSGEAARRARERSASMEKQPSSFDFAPQSI